LEQKTGERLLVVTGAAGRIGGCYRRHFGPRPGWRLRLQDIESVPEPGPWEVQTGDLADLDVARRAAAGAHTVLHLAADPSTGADFYGSLLERNIKATYNVFHAAAEAGARRLIFASSINAILGYPRETQVHPHMLARPANVYGATKVWGEALAATFVAQQKLPSAIAVRIGGVSTVEQVRRRRPSASLSFVVTEADLCRLFDCCLAAGPAVDFAVVHGTSRNRFLKLELEGTRRLVGYEPQDDAFAIAEGSPDR
jgi:NAD+ dependent glucose-6-phosphate dehydrogenase